MTTPTPPRVPPRVPDDVRGLLELLDDLVSVVKSNARAAASTDGVLTPAEEREEAAATDALLTRLAALAEDAARLREAVSGADVLKVTRFEVIDYRRGAPDPGRTYQAHGCSVTLSVQDEGRTLKVFVDDRTARAAHPTEERPDAE